MRDTPDVVVAYVEAAAIELLEPHQNRYRPYLTSLATAAEPDLGESASVS